MYADRHGIVSNEFYDPIKSRMFALKDRAAVEDGSWYFGEPLWVSVQKQGLRTATFFWVGSEAEIAGRRPNYYLRYSDQVPNADRVNQALKWLSLPEEMRPHLIMLYFSAVDSAGHRYGTKSPELRQAVLSVDEQIGRLREGIAKTGLPVNLVIVSDHGMVDLDPSKTFVIDQAPEVTAMLSKFMVVGRGPQLLMYLKPGEDKKLIRQTELALESIAAKNGNIFRVLRGKELAPLNYDSSPRVGDLVIDPVLPWVVGLKDSQPDVHGGNHGWNPQSLSMHGVFMATGPAFRNRAPLPTFENVDIYPLVMEVLRLKSPKDIDGKLIRTRSALAQ